MQKFKVSGWSVRTTEWKQTDGQTDGGDCITSHANAVGKYLIKTVEQHSQNVTNLSMWTVCSYLDYTGVMLFTARHRNYMYA